MSDEGKHQTEESRQNQQPSGGGSEHPQSNSTEQPKQRGENPKPLPTAAVTTDGAGRQKYIGAALVLGVGIFSATRAGRAMIGPWVGGLLWAIVAGLAVYGVSGLPSWPRLGRLVVSLIVLPAVYSLWQTSSPHGELTIKDVKMWPTDTPGPSPFTIVSVNIGYENTGQEPLKFHSYGHQSLVPVNALSDNNKQRAIENDAINQLSAYGDDVPPNTDLRPGRPSYTTAPVPMTPEQYREFKDGRLMALVVAKFRYQDWWPLARYVGYCGFVKGNGVIFLCDRQP